MIRSFAMVVFLVLVASPAARSETEAGLPSIVSFGGTGPVKVRVNGNETEAAVGSPIKYGSVIKTGPGNSVTVIYPDGSLLAVDSNTQLEVQEKVDGSQYNKLHYGQVRGSIEKVKAGETPPKKPKFLIRTRAAVLGVRGTEFVMAMDENALVAQVHTLEGAVDVAPDEGTLLSGNATSVQSGHFVEATNNGLSTPQTFNREEFIKSLDAPKGVPGSNPSGTFSNSAGHTAVHAPSTEASIPGSFLALKDSSHDSSGKPPPPQTPPPSAGLKDGAKDDDKKPEEKARKPRLLSFQGAAFFTNGFTGLPLRAASLSWDPIFPIPALGFLSVRGHFGADFGQDGSLNNALMISEYQAFGTATVLGRFFGELGMGEQVWSHGGADAGLFTANVGLITESGIFDRCFIGRSLLMVHPRVEEFKFGVGFVF